MELVNYSLKQRYWIFDRSTKVDVNEYVNDPGQCIVLSIVQPLSTSDNLYTLKLNKNVIQMKVVNKGLLKLIVTIISFQ